MTSLYARVERVRASEPSRAAPAPSRKRQGPRARPGPRRGRPVAVVPLGPMRGQLRIYLGAAPGVGKTFAMLNEGRRRAERGTDVVVGYVEAHGRANTSAQLGDLEVVPRRPVDHLGATLEEMDLDAVLARRPAGRAGRRAGPHQRPGLSSRQALAGRRGPPRSRDRRHHHPQHPAPRVPQRRGRAHHGGEGARDDPRRGGPAGGSGRAGGHGARSPPASDGPRQRVRRRSRSTPRSPTTSASGTSARCASSRSCGSRTRSTTPCRTTRPPTGSAMRGRRGSGSSSPSPAHPAASTSSGGRPASPAGWEGSSSGSTCRRRTGWPPSRALLTRHQQLVEDLGGVHQDVLGNDVATALTDFAKAEQATQLVLGASGRSRWAELLRGSVINDVLRRAGSLDVHVISVAEAEGGPAAATRRRVLPPVSPRRRRIGWLVVLVGLPLLTLLLTQLRGHLGLSSDLLLYLLLVVVAAAIGGVGPAVAAAVAGSLAANWFFTPPYHRFTVAQGENALALMVFLVVGALVSYLVLQAWRALPTCSATRLRSRRCAVSGRGADRRPPTLPPRPGRARRPTSSEWRCCARCPTTCARRWRRSRPGSPASCRATSTGRARRSTSSSPPSTRRATASTTSSPTSST